MQNNTYLRAAEAIFSSSETVPFSLCSNHVHYADKITIISSAFAFLFVYELSAQLSLAMATLNEISKLLDSSSNKLLSSIKQVKEDLKTEIQQLALSVSAKFANINKDVELLQQRCDIYEDMAKRIERRKELIVRNVPFLKDENIVTIAKNISSDIRFLSPYGAPVSFRLRNAKEIAVGTRATRSKAKEKLVKFPPILLKFATDWDAKSFMDRYYHKASLQLSDIGFNSLDR